jgi:PPP family 3-phenylpropionic acid transporter
MANKTGRKFIPSFIFSNFFLAIIAPYLVILLRDVGYNPLWVGILAGLFFEAAGVVGPFVLGHWADRSGNYRHVLLLSCILPALAAFPLVIWVNPVVSAIMLFVIAFGLRSLYSLVDAITTVQIGPDGNYGIIRIWGSIGFVVMTLFFQWTPFLRPENAINISIWIAITATACLIPVLLLPRHLLQVTHEHYAQHDAEGENKIPVTFTYIFCGFAVIFLSRFALTAAITYIPLFMTEIVKWDAVGLIFAISATAEIPFILIARYFIRRFGPMPLLVISALGVSLRLLILAFLPFKSWIIVSVLLHSLCFGIYHPAAIDFISKVYPVKKRGTGMSMYMIMGTGLPSITGIMAGGAIVQSLGYFRLFVIYAAVSALSVLIFAALRAGKR